MRFRMAAGIAGRPAVLFITVTLLWGIPYLLIAVALDTGLGPLSIVSVRTVLGAVALLVFAWRPAVALCRAAPGPLIVLAVVEVAVPFTLIAWGERTVSSATTGVLIATEPAFVLAASWLLGMHTRRSPLVVGGIAIGFVGVLLLLGAPGAGPGAGLILVAAACYGLGAVLVESWFPDTPRIALAAAMLVLAAVPVTVLATGLEPRPPLTGTAVTALLVLGVACTAGGFAAFFALIRSAGAAPASVITYTAPLVAIALGVCTRHEPFTWVTGAGTVLILVGAWLTMRTPQAHSVASDVPAKGRAMATTPVSESQVVRGLLAELPVPTTATTSRVVVNNKLLRVVVFAMDAGQELTEHTSTRAVTVQVLSGELDFTVGDDVHELAPGDVVYLAPNERHALVARSACRFTLVMVAVDQA